MRVTVSSRNYLLGSFRVVIAINMFLGTITGLSLLPTTVHATAVTDNFNRPNGALGSNWTTVPGDSTPAISGNQLTAGTDGQVNAAYWSADSFSNDQYVQAQFTTPFASGQYGPGIAVRMSASDTGYFLWYGNADDTVSIWRMDSATSRSQLVSSAALTIATTDTWRLEAVGGYLLAYQNGNLVLQTADDTYTSGSPGVWLYNNTKDVDNWAGGDTTPLDSLGGSVTGLNGTVTLQSAGVTNLAVTNNGQFTFNQALPNGSPYSVTVATQPTGQTCTVQNGSGTITTSAVTNIGVTCTGTLPTLSVTDNFNRADGGLGASWATATDGALSISSQAIVGAAGGTNSGATRTAESYPGDQYAQIDVGNVTGGDWIGPTVRATPDGQNLYLALYDYNNGAPYVQIFRRQAGNWSGISGTYACGALAPGTQIKLEAVGSAFALLINGSEKVSASDTTFTTGAPGIMAYGVPTADNFVAGNQGFEVHYLSSSNGVDTYDMLSPLNNLGPQEIKVLKPTSPAPGVPHNLIFTLPVVAGTDTTFGDGVATLQALNAQNQYNLTVIEPLFGLEPWYADSATYAFAQQESFMTTELVPWAEQNFRTSGSEQNWLMGFSKSGIGSMDLFLKHPDIFSLEAAWDWPADAATYADYGISSENSYGTDANFQDNYRLSMSFMEAHKAPVMAHPRIWIGGYSAFMNDVASFDAALTGLNIPHLTETPTNMVHRWDSGWVQLALAALAQMSPALIPPSPTPTPTPTHTPGPSPAPSTPASPSRNTTTASGSTGAAPASPSPSPTPPPLSSPSPSAGPTTSPAMSPPLATPLPESTTPEPSGILGITAITWGIGILIALGVIGLIVMLMRARARAGQSPPLQ